MILFFNMLAPERKCRKRQSIMNYITQSCKLVAVVLVVSLFPGCTSSNEQEAKITGTVDTSNNLSPTEAKGRMRGITPTEKPKDYNPSGGNRR